MNDQTTAGALLIGAIEAEFTGVRYSQEAKAALEQQLMPYGSVIQQNLADVVKRLRDEYIGTRIPPASLVLRSVKWVQTKSSAPVNQNHSQAPAGRPATPQEVSLIMRGWKAHGVEYAGELGQWMESGPHDYAELEASLPHQVPGEGDDVSSAITSMRWAG